MDVQLRELSQRHDAPQPRPPGGGQAPATLPATSADPVDVPQPSPTPADAGSPLGNQIEELERTAILRALEQTRYNRTAAAKLLGMTFRALRYRIKKLGIE
jgi:two-component system response regulator PilR (NtrC family)